MLYALGFIGKLFGGGHSPEVPAQPFSVFLTIDVIVLLFAGILLSTGWLHDLAARIKNSAGGTLVLNVWRPLEYTTTIAMLLVCSLYLVKQGYNPFIYFQF